VWGGGCCEIEQFPCHHKTSSENEFKYCDASAVRNVRLFISTSDSVDCGFALSALSARECSWPHGGPECRERHDRRGMLKDQDDQCGRVYSPGAAETSRVSPPPPRPTAVLPSSFAYSATAACTSREVAPRRHAVSYVSSAVPSAPAGVGARTVPAAPGPSACVSFATCCLDEFVEAMAQPWILRRAAASPGATRAPGARRQPPWSRRSRSRDGAGDRSRAGPTTADRPVGSAPYWRDLVVCHG